MEETGVVFALIRDNKVLMQQRDGNCARFPFMWCLPGGGSEKGESYEATLLREVKEEYDIDLKPDQCFYLMDYSDGPYPLKVYLCKIAAGQDPKLQEGLAMSWMTIGEIEKIKLGFHQEGIIPALRAAVL
ncbi:MAG TPA: NUDIX domain-containing protein [Candidatus Paceibacterota bacterium]